MRFLFVYITLFVSFLSFSQDFEKDIKAIVTKIDTTSSVAISVKVALYAKKGGSLLYSSTSTVDHSDKGTITKLGEMEMFTSSSYEVQIDHEEKKMLIHKVSKQKVDFSDLNLKEIKKLYEAEQEGTKKPTYTLLSNQNGVKTYVVKNVEGLKECQIVLDTQNDKIQKVIYEYTENGPNKGQYCVLDYSKFDYKPNYPANFFDTKNYFTYVNKQYELSKRLSTYKLFVE